MPKMCTQLALALLEFVNAMNWNVIIEESNALNYALLSSCETESYKTVISIRCKYSAEYYITIVVISYDNIKLVEY